MNRHPERLKYAGALEMLRSRARASPGTWQAADSTESGLTLAWRNDGGGSERLRVTRLLVPPFSEDLLEAAASMPADLEIGPIEHDRGAREMTLVLRPRTDRLPAERCERCGGRPRFGTRLFGDAQRCAVCTTSAPPEEDAGRNGQSST